MPGSDSPLSPAWPKRGPELVLHKQLLNDSQNPCVDGEPAPPTPTPSPSLSPDPALYVSSRQAAGPHRSSCCALVESSVSSSSPRSASSSSPRSRRCFSALARAARSASRSSWASASPACASRSDLSS